MLLLVTTAHPSLHEHGDPLTGEKLHRQLGRLLQPRHTSSARETALAGIPWAADNDAFVPPELAAELGVASWDAGKAERWLKMIATIADLPGCRFVTVPDVVCNAQATAELFEEWSGWVRDANLPVALVLQNGQRDVGVPWDRIDAVFIGGDDAWKEGEEAAGLAREAKARGKWVHWGRVNTFRRLEHIAKTGAADSCDGSQWAKFRDTHLDKGLRWLRQVATQTSLFAGDDPALTISGQVVRWAT